MYDDCGMRLFSTYMYDNCGMRLYIKTEQFVKMISK